MPVKSLTEKLEDLLNPAVKFPDPDDIFEDDTTRARIVTAASDDEEVEATDLVTSSSSAAAVQHGSHANAAPELARLKWRQRHMHPIELEEKYSGRPVTRSALAAQLHGQFSEEEDLQDQEQEHDLDQVESSDAGEDQDELDEGEESVQEEDSDDEDVAVADVSETGDSDESDALEDQAENGGDMDEDVDEATDAVGADSEPVAMFHSEPSDQVRRGIAVKSQLALWDQLLECRIKLQPCLQLANQLPPTNSWSSFWPLAESAAGGVSEQLQLLAEQAEQVTRQLLELQDAVMSQYPETRSLYSDLPPQQQSSEAGTTSPLDARRRAFQPYRDAVLQRWHDKTRVYSAGAGGGGGRASAAATARGKTDAAFEAFERTPVRLIEQIMSEPDRLLRRTRLRRSEYRVLGVPQPPPSITTQQQPSAGLDGGQYDSELFDDTDFYHQLLCELIERKTATISDPVLLGQQWTRVQKWRMSRARRHVDTRASKGRKVRYQVHPKLVNFMAATSAPSLPMLHNIDTDAASRRALIGSLFGRQRGSEIGGAAVGDSADLINRAMMAMT